MAANLQAKQKEEGWAAVQTVRSSEQQPLCSVLQQPLPLPHWASSERYSCAVLQERVVLASAVEAWPGQIAVLFSADPGTLAVPGRSGMLDIFTHL